MVIRLEHVIKFCGCEMRKEHLPQFMSEKATLFNSFGEVIGELEIPLLVLRKEYSPDTLFNFWALGVLRDNYPDKFEFLNRIKSL